MDVPHFDGTVSDLEHVQAEPALGSRFFVVSHYSPEGAHAFIAVDVDTVVSAADDRGKNVGFVFAGDSRGHRVEFITGRDPEMKTMAKLVREGGRPLACVDRAWVRNAEALPEEAWVGTGTLPPVPAPDTPTRNGDRGLLVMWLLFPAGVLFHYGKRGQGLACLLLQLTVIGWPLAVIWANLAIVGFEEG